jgi:phage FluMu protein Com
MEMVRCPVCKDMHPIGMVYRVDWRKSIENGYRGMICHMCNKTIDEIHFTHVKIKPNTLDAWLEENECEETKC